MESKQPTLFVVAGSNGAGKSTHSRDLLPDDMTGTAIWDFDMQYIEEKNQNLKSGMNLKDASIKANEQVNTWFNDLRLNAMQEKKPFAYEGHFTGGSQWQPLLDAKNEGYYVHMVFLGLSTVDASIARVAERVNDGGHYVDDRQVKMNYFGNMDMLDRNFKLPHRVDIFESDMMIDKVCTIERGIVTEAATTIPEWIKKEMPQINSLIEAHHQEIKNRPVRKITEDQPGQSRPKL